MISSVLPWTRLAIIKLMRRKCINKSYLYKMDSWGASEEETGVTGSQVTKLSDTEVEISRRKVVIF